MSRPGIKKKKRIVIDAANLKIKTTESQPPLVQQARYEDLIQENTILSDSEMRNIFDAKCRDYKIKFDERLYKRFKNSQNKKMQYKIFEMEASAVGPKTADVITQILQNHLHFKVICLSGNSLFDDGALSIAKFIAQNKNIISVDVSSCRIRDFGSAAIFKAMSINRTVIFLNIGSTTCVSRNSLGQLAIEELKDMLMANTVLSELDLSMSEISCEMMPLFSQGLSFNTTLQVLNMADNNIRAKGAVKLLHAIIKSNIKELNLSNNHIDDNVSIQLKSFLEKNKMIENLDLSGNKLTSKFINAISSPLSYETSLISLNLARNPISNVGALTLGRSISNNPRLEYLNISGCLIESNGFNEFCEEIQKNVAIKSIIASFNPILDEGLESLIELLKVHPTIQELDLEKTDLTDAGAIPLFNVIPECKTLQKLSFRSNIISDGLTIQKILVQSPHIRECDLNYNDISYKINREISKVIALNNKIEKEKRHELLIQKAKANPQMTQELKNARSDIIEEKQMIEILDKKLDEAHSDCIVAAQKRDESRVNFEQDSIEGNDLKNKTMMQYQNELEEIKAKKRRKDEESSILSRKQNDYEQQIGNLNIQLSTIETKIKAKQQQNISEMVDLDEQLANAIRKYNDFRMILISAYDLAKNPPPPPPIKIDEESNKDGPAPALEKGEKIRVKKKKRVEVQTGQDSEIPKNKETKPSKKKKKKT